MSATEIAEANERIRPHIVRTPLLLSPGLSKLLGCDVSLKAEVFQHTGSFKFRGAVNKALTLTDVERARGVIAYSAGNHAMAVAQLGRQLGIRVVVCMPDWATPFKIDAVRSLGAELELVTGDLVGRALARRDAEGLTLIPPFADAAVIAGAASVGVEIAQDLRDVDTVLVPVGGGGLISAVGAALKQFRAGVRIVGIEPETADVVRRSRAAGVPVTHPGPRSLADGLGAPMTGQINLDHIAEYVDEMVVITEDSIRPAWRTLVDVTKLAGEPSAAAGIAAIQTGAVTVRPGERVCLIISGGNADFAKLNAS